MHTIAAPTSGAAEAVGDVDASPAAPRLPMLPAPPDAWPSEAGVGVLRVCNSTWIGIMEPCRTRPLRAWIAEVADTGLENSQNPKPCGVGVE